jgi:hypothetical protein
MPGAPQTGAIAPNTDILPSAHHFFLIFGEIVPILESAIGRPGCNAQTGTIIPIRGGYFFGA